MDCKDIDTREIPGSPQVCQALILYLDSEEARDSGEGWESRGQGHSVGLCHSLSTNSYERYQYFQQPSWPYWGGTGGGGVDGASSIWIAFDRCSEVLDGSLARSFLCLTVEGTSVVLAWWSPSRCSESVALEFRAIGRCRDTSLYSQHPTVWQAQSLSSRVPSLHQFFPALVDSRNLSLGNDYKDVCCHSEQLGKT